MKKIKTRFKDLLVFETKIYPDKRGNVREAFKKNLIKKGLFLSVVSKSKKKCNKRSSFSIKKNSR